jgi:hypothetical protein
LPSISADNYASVATTARNSILSTEPAGAVVPLL